MNDSAYFAIYVVKNETDRILKKMKIGFNDLPKIYYFSPEKCYVHANEYEMIEEPNEELSNKCRELINKIKKSWIQNKAEKLVINKLIMTLIIKFCFFINISVRLRKIKYLDKRELTFWFFSTLWLKQGGPNFNLKRNFT